jgi:nitrous oxidase accessory protein
MKTQLFLILIICASILLSGCDQKENNPKQPIILEGKGEYLTINQAIENASENDTILIPDGTYSEILSLNISFLNVIGNDPEKTIIIGNNSGDVIHISAGNITISGIQIRNSGNGAYDAGIYVHASHVNINNTIITNCFHGIYLHQDTTNNTIQNNVFSQTQNGVYGIQTKNNTILNNTFSENKQYGIYIRFYSNKNKIINNSFYDNDIGMRVKSSKYNIISHNHVIGSPDRGIYVCCGAEENIFYKNVFINNSVNAYDSLDNSWYFNETGNYWDDYEGSDANNDGIGDTPYQIPGGAIDNYPLLSI